MGGTSAFQAINKQQIDPRTGLPFAPPNHTRTPIRTPISTTPLEPVPTAPLEPVPTGKGGAGGPITTMPVQPMPVPPTLGGTLLGKQPGVGSITGGLIGQLTNPSQPQTAGAGNIVDAISRRIREENPDKVASPTDGLRPHGPGKGGVPAPIYDAGNNYGQSILGTPNPNMPVNTVPSFAAGFGGNNSLAPYIQNLMYNKDRERPYTPSWQDYFNNTMQERAAASKQPTSDSGGTFRSILDRFRNGRVGDEVTNG